MGIVYGSPPAKCAICAKPFGQIAYDAFHPRDRAWGWFCSTCFKRSGAALGVGRGQQFSLQPSDQWIKTKG